MDVHATPASIVAPDLLSFRAERGFDMPMYDAAIDLHVRKVARYVASVSDPHPLVGKRVAVPYADGLAEYIIANIAGTVCLVHLDIMDGWRDPRFERSVTVAELEQLARPVNWTSEGWRA